MAGARLGMSSPQRKYSCQSCHRHRLSLTSQVWHLSGSCGCHARPTWTNFRTYPRTIHERIQFAFFLSVFHFICLICLICPKYKNINSLQSDGYQTDRTNTPYPVVWSGADALPKIHCHSCCSASSHCHPPYLRDQSARICASGGNLQPRSSNGSLPFPLMQPCFLRKFPIPLSLK